MNYFPDGVMDNIGNVLAFYLKEAREGRLEPSDSMYAKAMDYQGTMELLCGTARRG